MQIDGKPYDRIGSKPEKVVHSFDGNGKLISRILAGSYPFIGAALTGSGIFSGTIYLVAEYRDGAYQKTDAVLVLDNPE